MVNGRCTGRRKSPEVMAAALQEAAAEVRLASMEAEEDMPMRRYIRPNEAPGGGLSEPWAACPGQETRAMLEQLVELDCARNQLLMDLLGAVNALTAAILSAQNRQTLN